MHNWAEFSGYVYLRKQLTEKLFMVASATGAERAGILQFEALAMKYIMSPTLMPTAVL